MHGRAIARFWYNMRMKISLFALSLSLLTGCLTATVPDVSYWTVTPPEASVSAATNTFGVVRVSQVLVRAPYDSRQLVVRRTDGSLAFDPYNQFAALPSQLFKAPVIAAISRSGLCTAAVDASSSVRTDFLAEAVVTDLALTTTPSGALKANVAVLVRMLDRQRALASVASGVGEADVTDGSYTEAFSAAFGTAIRKALSDL